MWQIMLILTGGDAVLVALLVGVGFYFFWSTSCKGDKKPLTDTGQRCLRCLQKRVPESSMICRCR